MKIDKLAGIVLSLFCGIIACSKENLSTRLQANAVNSNSNGVNSGAVNCDLFAYPDTVFYPKTSASDYLVMPLNVQTGRYGSFPDVMKIDRNSGAINITKSETGLKYIVWFIPDGTKDTCKKFVTISGINYTDSIFTLVNKKSVSIPIYNANTQEPIACNGGCSFGQNLVPQGIAVNKSTGVIDLKQSLLNGALGTNPKNGTFKDFVMQYKISDKSGSALNSISFRLYYYKLKSQIPDSLINILNAKKSQVLLDDDTEADDDKLLAGANNGNLLNVLTTPQHDAGETRCRPPYIIVTQK